MSRFVAVFDFVRGKNSFVYYCFYKIVSIMKSFPIRRMSDSFCLPAFCLLFNLSLSADVSAQNVIGHADGPTSIVIADESDLLLDKGRCLIDRMRGLASSKDYVEYCSASSEISRCVSDMADWLESAPKSVFVMENMRFDDMKKFSKASSDIRRHIRECMTSALPARLNAMSGSSVLAAASMLSVDDSFLFCGLDESKTYLYLYPSGCGVIVNFRPASLWNVRVQAGLVVGDFLRGLESAADVEHFFAGKLGVRAEISEIK